MKSFSLAIIFVLLYIWLFFGALHILDVQLLDTTKWYGFPLFISYFAGIFPVFIAGSTLGEKLGLDKP